MDSQVARPAPSHPALARVRLVISPTAEAHVRGDCMKSVHGSFLANVSTDLREALHHPGLTVKPFTVSTLEPLQGAATAGFDRQVRPGLRFAWHLTGLAPDLVDAIATIAGADTVEVDRATFRVEHEASAVDRATLPNDHGAAGLGQGESENNPSTTYHATDYGALLEASRADDRITLHFVTPTAFKAGDVTVPFPLPDSVFGGYLDTWEMFSTVPLGIDPGIFRHACRDRIQVESHSIRTRSAWFDHPIPGGGERRRKPIRFVGFVGACTYRILDRDVDHRRLFNTLAAFGEYCGTGSKKAQGAGQTRFEPLGARA